MKTETEEEDKGLPEIPDTLWKNTKIRGKTWVCGAGPKPADIMFVSPVISFEEAEDKKRVGFDKYIPRTPRHTDSGSWQIVKAIALEHGIDINDAYVTSIVKYLPENKSHQTKPPKTLLMEGMTILENEIKKVKPKIIVCLGKLAFDTLYHEKLAADDIYGAWFTSKQYKCRLYPMLHISQALKPDKSERWHLDFANVSKELKAMNGVEVEDVPLNYMVIHNAAELESLTTYLELINATVLSIDGEWHGNQHIDGKLRTFQLCWAPGQAACIRFMDDQLNYVFDVSYKEAGAILSKWVDRPEVKYIGHHVSVDLTWMHYWLGTKWYRKAIFDSEFATQLCDESLDLGLDAVALRYTPFGKYDLDLIRWKKKNVDKCKEGYGYIPDDILIPYSMMDVDTVMRAWPHLTRWMKKQGLTRYYNEICNPFVTDVFTYWCLKGIPIDREKLNEVRDLYNWAKDELEKDFLTSMVQDAKQVLKKRLEEAGSDRADAVIEALDDVLYRGYRKAADELAKTSSERRRSNVTIDKETGLPTEALEAANELIKNEVGAAEWTDVKTILDHYISAPRFNIRSKKHMQRWLFEVKQYTPVKSTANKAEGAPAVDWNKVLTYPPDKQKLFTPASDIGTLEILASRYHDPVIDQLLEFNKVGNISKSFLPAAAIDEETGQPIGEKGIAQWLATDSKIHLNHSTTS